MRGMKSRVLAAIMAAGMIFTAQGMTALAGTTGIGAAKTAQSTQCIQYRTTSCVCLSLAYIFYRRNTALSRR